MAKEVKKTPFPVYYYAGADYFCGREQDQEKLLSALQNGRNVTLMSERRMGKTGLIKNMFERIEQQKDAPICIYADIFATKSLDDFVKVLSQNIIGKQQSPIDKMVSAMSSFLKNSRFYLSTDPISGSSQLGIDFQPREAQHTLQEIFDYLRHINKEVYLAIDEFQQIAAYADSGIEALLREQMQFSQNIHFIFSGSKQHLMNEIFTSPSRPFYRSTDKMTLYAIPRQQYCDFARRFFTSANRELPQELFYSVYDRFEGHTWFVQYTLNRLWERPTEVLSEEDVAIALQEILQAEDDNFRNLYEGLTDNQSLLLRAIANEKLVSKVNASDFIARHKLGATSSVNRALKTLVDRELVYKQKDGYRVYDRFFQLWLCRMFY